VCVARAAGGGLPLEVLHPAGAAGGQFAGCARRLPSSGNGPTFGAPQRLRAASLWCRRPTAPPAVRLTRLPRAAAAPPVPAVIKKEFDRKHGPTWHVVVGRNYGSYVTHETKSFAYFYLGQLAFLIFKTA
jgi:hypothetical protein